VHTAQFSMENALAVLACHLQQACASGSARQQTSAASRGCLALNVVFDIERELERADALGAFLSMDEYSPDALVASLELLTKRARHVPQN
jgi:hypothetical protein